MKLFLSFCRIRAPQKQQWATAVHMQQTSIAFEGAPIVQKLTNNIIALIYAKCYKSKDTKIKDQKWFLDIKIQHKV